MHTLQQKVLRKIEKPFTQNTTKTSWNNTDVLPVTKLFLKFVWKGEYL